MRRVGVLAVVLALSAVPAPAQRGDNRLRSLRDNPAVIAAFADVVAKADACAVVVKSDGERVALGTVVDTDCLIVTKASELGDGDLSCVIAGEEYKAQRLGVDALDDLALLRVEGVEGLRAAPWADAEPKRGAWLVSVDGGGSPAGIGILSSAPYSHSVDRGYLGVQLHSTPSPVRLKMVYEDTAAHSVGLEADDVILAMDGTPFTTSSEFIRAIRAHKAGDDILLRIERGEEELELKATLRRDRRGQRSSQENLWGPLSEVRAGFATVLQHDTILTPESCGGPLVDLDGNVVGVNIARAGRIETLALPAAEVRAAVERMRAGK